MTVTKEQIIKSLEETIREVKTMPSDNFKSLCNNVKTPCEHCSCNPKNGGSGMCNCTLACPKIT